MFGSKICPGFVDQARKYGLRRAGPAPWKQDEPDAALKILCTADLHLGRRSSRIPEDLDGVAFSCARGWQRVVDLALAREVDLVLLGGDLIDRRNRFYEAFGPLEKGLARLSRAGIQTLAVAGNHDYESLPEFLEAASDLDFTLLGAHQPWESLIVEAGGEKVQVLGWSFRNQFHRHSPVRDWNSEPEPGMPVLGLLHGELDQAQGVYAPVSSAELSSLGLDALVVGHFHRSFLSDTGPLILVPGSPQALDPGEPGVHGPWIMEVRQGRVLAPTQVPLSTVRYEEVRVDLSGTDQEDQLSAALINAVRALAAGLGTETGPLELLSLRLILEGRTALHGRLEALTREAAEFLSLESSSPRASLEKVAVQTRPHLDLEGLASGSGLTAHLAGLILALENQKTNPDQDRLIREAGEKLSRIHQAGPYLSLDQEPPGADQVREMMVAQSFILLEELLQQKERA